MVEVFERHEAPVIAVQRVRETRSAYGVIAAVPEGDNDRVYRIQDLVRSPGRRSATATLPSSAAHS